MGKKWRDCVVTLIDLIGLKKLAQYGEASRLMREFHKLVTKEKRTLSAIDHAYVWNDSALLLSYVDGHKGSFEAAIRDADRLKRLVDKLRKSYAVAVKGRAFPPVGGQHKTTEATGVTFIRASSWAMANCFKIEDEIKNRRKSWALDSWIREKIQIRQDHFEEEKMRLLPLKQRRSVYFFAGYLWD